MDYPLNLPAPTLAIMLWIAVERGLGLESVAAIAIEQYQLGISEPFW